MNQKPYLTLSVHFVVDLLLRRGDIDDRVYNQETMQMGTKLHSSYQQKQGNSYLAEYPLSAVIEVEEGTLAVSGRADGIIVNGDYPVIDEIKSTVLPLDVFFEQQEEWHLGQALFYAYMYLKEKGGSEAGVQLTYLSQNNPDETMVKHYHFTRSEIEKRVEGLCSEFLQDQAELLSHHQERDASAKDLKFPYADFRGGQRDFAKYAYGAVKNGGYFFCEAPTGIGKTMSSLYPAVKGFKRGRVDRLFYLTAKNTGGYSAYNALTDLYEAGFKGRDSFLLAKEKICFHPGHSCNPDDCPFAKDYYTKLRSVLKETVASGKRFDSLTVSEYCRKHAICPFEFQLDLSLNADVIICDYNYFFDPIVHLERYFTPPADSSTFFMLVDEAHNLVDRGKNMYSSEIDSQECHFAKKSLEGKAKSIQSLKRALGKVENALESLIGPNDDVLDIDDVPEEVQKALDSLKRAHQKASKEGVGRLPDQYRFFSRETNRFQRLYSEYFGAKYHLYVERRGERVILHLMCLDASKFLSDSLSRVRGAVFFSATLSPLPYYQKCILGREDLPSLLLPSPFPKENFNLLIAPKISVRFKDRERSYKEVASYLNAFVNGKMGNYFLYFPSYEYMENIRPYLDFPKADILIQDRKMTNDEKEEFLESFEENPSHTAVGLLILGGAFSEGIDLVSDRLIGVGLVGVGLPQVGFEVNLLRDYWDSKEGKGFDYAYRFPGINKVTQAVGRLIRSETDRGSALLIDDRFLKGEYRDIFERVWPSYNVVTDPSEIKEALEAFYKKDED